MPEESFKRKLTAILSAVIEGKRRMADRPTIPRASIQRRALALVLPLVIASMLSIGLVSFHTLNKQTAKRSERFLQDRRNEILTISEDQS
ncbi:MAG: hypothetical protein GTO13_19535, partial [Proteobacteria bacterium]|nr:hypothetical protein [Pseudomonadota bacterium]